MKHETILHKIAGYFFSIMIFFLLCLCIRSQQPILLGNEIILLLFGLLFCLISYLVVMAIPLFPKSRVILFHFLLGLSLLQCYSIYLYYFHTGWDPGNIMSAAYCIAKGEPLEAWHLSYFSRYPNNSVILLIYAFLLRFGMWFQSEEQAYFGILVFQCLLSFVTELLLYLSVSKLCSKRLGVFSVLLYTLMVGFSPWLSIPYSDSLTLIIPIGIFALYLMEASSPAKRMAKWMLIGMIGYFGYRLKPQCIIIVIAIVLLEGIHGVSALRKKKTAFSFAAGGSAFLSGILICMLLLNLAVAKLPMETNSEEAFGMPHFFMMGLNTERRGGWFAEDVEFSASFSTKEERNRNDWIRAADRIQQMGITGLIEHIKTKLQYTYDDGTFFWAGEGTFYRELLDKGDSPFSLFLKSLYYVDNIHVNDYEQTGVRYWVWRTLAQGLWLAILSLCIFSGLSMWGNSDALRRHTCVLPVSVIGLTLFEAIFEARSRYLFNYLPIYLILAAVGLKSISGIIVSFVLQLENIKMRIFPSKE